MKYKITDETTKYLGRILHRIEALCAFDDVKIGDKIKCVGLLKGT